MRVRVRASRSRHAISRPIRLYEDYEKLKKKSEEQRKQLEALKDELEAEKKMRLSTTLGHSRISLSVW